MKELIEIVLFFAVFIVIGMPAMYFMFKGTGWFVDVMEDFFDRRKSSAFAKKYDKEQKEYDAEERKNARREARRERRRENRELGITKDDQAMSFLDFANTRENK